MSAGEPAAYSFKPRLERRQALGSNPAQLAIAGAGFVVFVLSVLTGTVLVGPPAVAATVIVAFWPLYDDHKLYRRLIPRLAFFVRRAAGEHRVRVGLPLLSGDLDDTRSPARGLPACLTGLELAAVDRPDWAGRDLTVAPLVVVRDRRARELTGVLAVQGSEFGLLPEAERDRLIRAWGWALGSFARSNSPARRLAWHEWSCPLPHTEHLEFLAVHGVADSPAAAAYRELLDETTPVAPRHEVRVTVTVDPARGRRRRAGGLGRRVDTILDELRALHDRCVDAGLRVAPPVSPAEHAELLRAMADPRVAVAMRGRRRRLGDRLGLVAPVAAVPLAVDVDWDHVRVDGAFHRVYWVTGWPVAPVGARWMEPLLTRAPNRIRTLTVICEPVAPAKARSRVAGDLTDLTAKRDKLAGHGQVVPQALDDELEALRRREREINDGFGEFGYLALLTVTGRTLAELDDACFELERVATDDAQLELRPLDGRHDRAWACTLPLGRAPDRTINDRVRL